MLKKINYFVQRIQQLGTLIQYIIILKSVYEIYNSAHHWNIIRRIKY